MTKTATVGNLLTVLNTPLYLFDGNVVEIIAKSKPKTVAGGWGNYCVLTIRGIVSGREQEIADTLFGRSATFAPRGMFDIGVIYTRRIDGQPGDAFTVCFEGGSEGKVWNSEFEVTCASEVTYA